MESAKMTMAERGRRGGMTTYAKHGPGHMAAIGGRGFASFTQTHASGNKAAARRMLGLDGRRRDYDSTKAEAILWLEERKKG